MADLERDEQPVCVYGSLPGKNVRSPSKDACLLSEDGGFPGEDGGLQGEDSRLSSRSESPLLLPTTLGEPSSPTGSDVTTEDNDFLNSSLTPMDWLPR
jgi:hypothetical protein